MGRLLEEALRISVLVPENPQMVGALGEAQIASGGFFKGSRESNPLKLGPDGTSGAHETQFIFAPLFFQVKVLESFWARTRISADLLRKTSARMVIALK